VSLDTVIS